MGKMRTFKLVLGVFSLCSLLSFYACNQDTTKTEDDKPIVIKPVVVEVKDATENNNKQETKEKESLAKELTE